LPFYWIAPVSELVKFWFIKSVRLGRFLFPARHEVSSANRYEAGSAALKISFTQQRKRRGPSIVLYIHCSTEISIVLLSERYPLKG
jgi:hypothetical protein